MVESYHLFSSSWGDYRPIYKYIYIYHVNVIWRVSFHLKMLAHFVTPSSFSHVVPRGCVFSPTWWTLCLTICSFALSVIWKCFKLIWVQPFIDHRLSFSAFLSITQCCVHLFCTEYSTEWCEMLLQYKMNMFWSSLCRFTPSVLSYEWFILDMKVFGSITYSVYPSSQTLI